MSLYKDISILVVTPAYGGQLFVGYLTSLMKFERLCRDKGILVNYEYHYNESLITKARNTLTDTFMNSIQYTQYTHLLCLDADIEFEPEDIIKMLDYNKPVIGGIYPKKKINWDKITELANQTNEITLTSEAIQAMTKEPVLILLDDSTINVNDDFIETRYTGTGILLVQRNVFEKMRTNFPNDIYNKIYFRYFDTEIKDGIYLSEDYWFCDRWRQLGGKIYVYTKFKCRHWGTYAF